MDLALIVVCGAAAYRVARLITLDSLTKTWRLKLAGRLGMVGNRPHRLAELITCPACASVWTAAGAVGWAWYYGPVGTWHAALLDWWAVAGVAALVGQIDVRLSR